MAAGAVGGQTAVPDAWIEKVARMFELFTDPNGTGINEEYQRNLIKQEHIMQANQQYKE